MRVTNTHRARKCRRRKNRFQLTHLPMTECLRLSGYATQPGVYSRQSQDRPDGTGREGGGRGVIVETPESRRSPPENGDGRTGRWRKSTGMPRDASSTKPSRSIPSHAMTRSGRPGPLACLEAGMPGLPNAMGARCSQSSSIPKSRPVFAEEPRPAVPRWRGRHRAAVPDVRIASVLRCRKCGEGKVGSRRAVSKRA